MQQVHAINPGKLGVVGVWLVCGLCVGVGVGVGVRVHAHTNTLIHTNTLTPD